MNGQESNALVDLLAEAVQGRIAEIRTELHQSVEEALARVATSFLRPEEPAEGRDHPSNGQHAAVLNGSSY